MGWMRVWVDVRVACTQAPPTNDPLYECIHLHAYNRAQMADEGWMKGG